MSHRSISRKAAAAALGVLTLLAASCAADDSDSTDGSAPVAVATTSIWADVLANVDCDGELDIRTLIPAGGDPHRFEPSLADRALMDDAAIVVANGLRLEELLEDTLEAVEDAGTPVFRLGERMSPIAYSFGEESHDDHDSDDHEVHDDDEDGHHEDHDHDEDADHGSHGEDEEDHEEGADHDEDEDHESHEDADHAGDDDDHAGDDHSDDDHAGDDDDHAGHDEHEGHDHSGDDPHVWFDPQRVSDVLAELGQQLVTHAGLDAAAVGRCVAGYEAELAELDAEIVAMTAGLHADDRLLVTNHEAMGYFAERYGFELIGTVIPSPSGLAETNPAQLEQLAQTILEHGVGAIFAETQHSATDAEALAERVGDVEVVTLFTGTLGPAGSGAEDYLGFMRTNARLITDALS